jgi:transposase
MKRRVLIAMIKKKVRELQLQNVVFSEGSNHSQISTDTKKISVPRHKEIDENLARSIMKQLESELGERWWI